MKVAIVTNIPAPYRLPVYEKLADHDDVDLCVFYFSGREPDREWDLKDGRFKQVYLKERYLNFRGRFIHANPDLWGRLRDFRPDVVVTTGFNPSHLLAYAYSCVHQIRHVAMTDGTYESEASLSRLHPWVRRIVYAGTQSFVGASDGAFSLYESYGIDPGKVFKSHLCANNSEFFRVPFDEKRFDFIFCGRFVAVKNPMFAIEVARSTARRLGRRVSMLFVGSGELEPMMQIASASSAHELDCVFAGFARQDELPRHYASARIFLFPTRWDPWGVVANEACAAGLPVIVSPVAGSAGELILDGQNGFVLPCSISQWTEACVRLLTDRNLYESMSARSISLVQEYNYDNAASGIANAIQTSRAGDRRALRIPWRRRSPRSPLVAIIQRRLTHYRVPLFELMREELARVGVELIVVYGDPTAEERQKMDSGTLSWGIHVPCRYWLNNRICWQNANEWAREADLIIVTQENKLLFNFAFRVMHPRRTMAFWGHGRNFQAPDANALSERMKHWLVNKVEWWFVYTELSKKVVVDEAGFPVDQVTVLDNSIDTRALRADMDRISEEDILQARKIYGISAGKIGISMASLHADKRLDFLIEAAVRVRRSVPDFQLLIVGDGPLRAEVERAVETAGGWIHWMGAKRGPEKALLLRMSSVVLNPGMVGLTIIDSFVARRPLITIESNTHSPEIAYLDNGVNAIMAAPDIDCFSEAVVRLLTDEALYQRLQAGCAVSAEHLSVEKMASRFCEGIARCLARNGTLAATVQSRSACRQE